MQSHKPICTNNYKQTHTDLGDLLDPSSISIIMT